MGRRDHLRVVHGVTRSPSARRRTRTSVPRQMTRVSVPAGRLVAIPPGPSSGRIGRAHPEASKGRFQPAYGLCPVHAPARNGQSRARTGDTRIFSPVRGSIPCVKQGVFEASRAIPYRILYRILYRVNRLAFMRGTDGPCHCKHYGDWLDGINQANSMLDRIPYPPFFRENSMKAVSSWISTFRCRGQATKLMYVRR
jgi:hypothetical protein